MSEPYEEKIRRVAKRIQDILVEERCAMIPTISIQVVEEQKIVTPPPPFIV